jgi:hypothetical protein
MNFQPERRRSADHVWPLRNADGQTFAEAKTSRERLPVAPIWQRLGRVS